MAKRNFKFGVNLFPSQSRWATLYDIWSATCRGRELRRRRVLRAEQGRVQRGPARAHEVVAERVHPETLPGAGRQDDEEEASNIRSQD